MLLHFFTSEDIITVRFFRANTEGDAEFRLYRQADGYEWDYIDNFICGDCCVPGRIELLLTTDGQYRLLDAAPPEFDPPTEQTIEAIISGGFQPEPAQSGWHIQWDDAIAEFGYQPITPFGVWPDCFMCFVCQGCWDHWNYCGFCQYFDHGSAECHRCWQLLWSCSFCGDCMVGNAGNVNVINNVGDHLIPVQTFIYDPTNWPVYTPIFHTNWHGWEVVGIRIRYTLRCECCVTVTEHNNHFEDPNNPVYTLSMTRLCGYIFVLEPVITFYIEPLPPTIHKFLTDGGQGPIFVGDYVYYTIRIFNDARDVPNWIPPFCNAFRHFRVVDPLPDGLALVDFQVIGSLGYTDNSCFDDNILDILLDLPYTVGPQHVTQPGTPGVVYILFTARATNELGVAAFWRHGQRCIHHGRPAGNDAGNGDAHLYHETQPRVPLRYLAGLLQAVYMGRLLAIDMDGTLPDSKDSISAA